MSQGTTTEAAVAGDYADLVDKMVIMTVVEVTTDSLGNSTVIPGTEAEVTGTLMSYNPIGGAVFKPKSARVCAFYGAEEIVSIVREKQVSAALRPVGQKNLRPQKGPGARRHLADFHGFSLSTLNGMSDEAALALHDEIDHSDLGHNHDLDEGARNSKAEKDTQRTRADILDAIAAA